MAQFSMEIMRLTGSVLGADQHWRPSRIIEKGSEHPQRSELDCNAQTIVITTVHGDKNTIGVIEMEVAGELI